MAAGFKEEGAPSAAQPVGRSRPHGKLPTIPVGKCCQLLHAGCWYTPSVMPRVTGAVVHPAAAGTHHSTGPPLFQAPL